MTPTPHDIESQINDLLHSARNTLPPGRELYLVVTNLEQALLWARRAVEVAQ